MEIGVTAYNPSEEGKPQLEFEHCSKVFPLSEGIITGSKMFELTQGEELVIRLYKGPAK